MTDRPGDYQRELDDFHSGMDEVSKPTFPPLPPGLPEVMVLTGHRTVGFGTPLPDFDRIYDKLAARLYVSREFVKRMTYMIGYGGRVDPWIRHLVNTEIEAILQEHAHG